MRVVVVEVFSCLCIISVSDPGCYQAPMLSRFCEFSLTQKREFIILPCSTPQVVCIVLTGERHGLSAKCAVWTPSATYTCKVRCVLRKKKNVPAKLPRRYEMELVWRAHHICWAIFFCYLCRLITQKLCSQIFSDWTHVCVFHKMNVFPH